MYMKNHTYYCFSTFAACEYQKRLTKFKLATLKFIIPCWRPIVYAHAPLPTMQHAQTHLFAASKNIDCNSTKLFYLTIYENFRFLFDNLQSNKKPILKSHNI